MVNYPTIKGNHIPHMGDVVPHSARLNDRGGRCCDVAWSGRGILSGRGEVTAGLRTDHPIDLGQPYVNRLGFTREGDVLPDHEGDVANRDVALVATVLGRDGR